VHVQNPTSTPRDGVELLTIKEVMARLKVSRSAFYLIAKDTGFIRKVRGAARVPSHLLDLYIANLPHSREVR
jgi:hypothetical protein